MSLINHIIDNIYNKDKIKNITRFKNQNKNDERRDREANSRLRSLHEDWRSDRHEKAGHKS